MALIWAACARSNLTAVIPDYSKEKLLIDTDIKGPGKAVGPYFDETPLKDSLVRPCKNSSSTAM